MRTVVLPHVNEWKRVPKVARGVVAERGRWDGRRCEEEGNGSSREEREREKEEEGHTSGSKEARARKRETNRRSVRVGKREKGEKKGDDDAKHMGLVSNVANYYVVKVGLCPVKGRPKDVSLAISNDLFFPANKDC